MNKKIFRILIFLFLIRLTLSPEIFVKFAKPDKDYMARVQGKWIFSGSRYLIEFTNSFSRKIDGLSYYLYKNSKYPKNFDFIYAIFKSKKTGISYFCRGVWSKRMGFRYSVSRIKFRGRDKFFVYSKNDPNRIYFTAKRVH